MRIHVTPELMEAVYEMLRLTPPFKSWKMPHADDVDFYVMKTRENHGDCGIENGRHFIRISYRTHKTLFAVILTMAHEMCHVQEHRRGVRGDHQHGRVFHKLADSVCKNHGWDRGQF
jgi:hypothetical protein